MTMMTEVGQTGHGVIGRIPEGWLLAPERAEGEAVRALELREELLPLFDNQAEHPVMLKLTEHDFVREARSSGGLIAALEWMIAKIKERESVIRAMEEDPFHHGYEPPMWRKILIWLCRKRLELPSRVLLFIVLGGIRSGKTELGGKRMAQQVAVYHRLTKVGRYQSWVWGVHPNETRSKDIGQECVHRNLPRLWRATKIGNKEGGRLKYLDGSGFTGNQFVYQNRLGQFMFGGMDQKSLQGPELTFAWLDEELPPSLCKTAEERLTTHAAQAAHPKHLERIRVCLYKLERGEELTPEEIAAVHLGVRLHTFTPKEGWSKVVADALTGAVTLEEEDAPALPRLAAGGLPEVDETGRALFKKAPRVKQCKDPAGMIFYIWSQDNAWGGYESVLGTCAGSDEGQKRIILYGDVEKDWRTAYPGYQDKHFSEGGHLINLNEIPRDVTIRRYVDAAESRPMFTVWIGVDRAGRKYVLNEWPREGDYIPGWGDPGPWAEPGDGQRKDGVPGLVQQKLLAFGFDAYMEEWERVERQLAAWKSGAPGGGQMSEGTDVFKLSPGELEKFEPVKLQEQLMDSRLGNAPTMREGGKSTLMDDFNELGCDFTPASGDRLREGDKKINDALAPRKEGLFTGPRLLVGTHCLGVRFTLGNYTGDDGAKGACKDPRDAVVFDLTNDDGGYVDRGAARVRGGGAF